MCVREREKEREREREREELKYFQVTSYESQLSESLRVFRVAQKFFK